MMKGVILYMRHARHACQCCVIRNNQSFLKMSGKQANLRLMAVRLDILEFDTLWHTEHGFKTHS